MGVIKRGTIGILTVVALSLIGTFVNWQIQWEGTTKQIWESSSESTSSFAAALISNDAAISSATAATTIMEPTTTQAPLRDADYCRKLKCTNEAELPYWIRSGYGFSEGPLICVDGKIIVSPTKPETYSRGINIVVINAKLKAVMDYRSFDTHIDVKNCLDAAKYLALTVAQPNPVLIATFDEMTNSFCVEAKEMLSKFGSAMVNQAKFRDNWVFAGYSGLKTGAAVEKLASANGDKSFGAQNEIQGCMTMPAQAAAPSLPELAKKEVALEDCGVPGCAYDEIAVYASTGVALSVKPTACVGGSNIIPSQTKGGTGLNFIVIDRITKQALASRQFNSNTRESSPIDLFLEELDSSVILVGIVHDDASSMLQASTKRLLEGFGADRVKDLAFRSVMYFVGQKGLSSSPYQEIQHVIKPLDWPSAIQKRICVPADIRNAVDNIQNEKRKDFCSHHGGYGDFCYMHHSHESLRPAPVAESAMTLGDILDVPIVVLAGFNHFALTHVLRSLLAVPGLKCDQVTVVSPAFFTTDYKELVNLFQFGYLEIGVTNKYHELVERAISQVWKQKNSSEYLIVIEEEVIVTPDFLQYMQTALDAMKAYKSIGAASAWNPNGFVHAASDETATYYVDGFVGMAFMLSKQFYVEYMQNHMTDCCSERSWQGWFNNNPSMQKDFLIPEVPRAELYRVDSLYASYGVPTLAALSRSSRILARKNSTLAPITSPSDYKSFVKSTLSDATDANSVTICLRGEDSRGASQRKWKGKSAFGTANGSSSGSKPLAVVYNQKDVNDYGALAELCDCLSLSCAHSSGKPLGLQQGLLRFSLRGTMAFLIGTKSEYNKS